MRNPFLRADIRPGLRVRIVLKKDQPTGNLTEGYVKDILTNAPVHTRGIKVRLAYRSDKLERLIWAIR